MYYKIDICYCSYSGGEYEGGQVPVPTLSLLFPRDENPCLLTAIGILPQSHP